MAAKAMLARLGCCLGVVGEWRARRCLQGWVCGGEGSGGLVELFGGVVGGGDLVVASCLAQNNDSN